VAVDGNQYHDKGDVLCMIPERIYRAKMHESSMTAAEQLKDTIQADRADLPGVVRME